MKLAARIWIACALFHVAAASGASPDVFHPPFRIEMDGKPLDTGADNGHAGPCVFDVNGDGLDDLVVGDFSGTFRVLMNRGTAGKPRYADGGRIEAGGVSAKVHIYCCVAAQPRFCDLDGDGLDDMLANSYDPGHCHFFKGQPDGGFAAGVELMDTSGAPVRAHPQQEHKHLSFGSFFAPVDWDDDGDLDLLIGCFDGGLKVRLNTGTPRAPAFAPDNVVVEAADKPLRVPQHCCPNVADWDGDGRWDILAGSDEGSVWWFRNVGGPGAPRFAAGECLVDPPACAKCLSINPVPGTRTQTEVADYDGDGRLDLLVGDYGDMYDCKPDLGPDEAQTCQKLFAAYAAADQAASRKSEPLRAPDAANDHEAWLKAKAEYDQSPEVAERRRTLAAFEDYVSPRLQSDHQLTAILKDGSKKTHVMLSRPRGHVWVYLRK